MNFKLFETEKEEMNFKDKRNYVPHLLFKGRLARIFMVLRIKVNVYVEMILNNKNEKRLS